MSRPTTEAISEFLYDEGELLDEWRLDDWIQLFTDDCIYWIPGRLGADVDPLWDTSHVYDDRGRLEERVWRLTHGPAYRQLPRSELSHAISNVRLRKNEGGSIVVTSRFVITEYRRELQRVFAGRATHHLVEQGDGFKIQMKRVDLVDCTSPLTNLTMIL